MAGRANRRERIESAFDEFRNAVAAALGAASRAHKQASYEYARRLFELWLREDGLDAILANPGFARALRSQWFADIVQRAVEDRDQAFAPWVAQGPQSLAETVAMAAPGSASEPYATWLGQPGIVDLQGYVPELWRIGSGVAESSPANQQFPVAVPLLDHSHLSIATTPQTRPQAEALVESLLLRILSYFRPGLVHLHVWDVSQLTGSLPGLYPLTRVGLLTVHNPARPDDMLEELSEHIRRVHTSVLIDGHVSLRSLAQGTGVRTEPWRIAVLFGNRDALSTDHQQQLQRIARNGLASGVQLIAVDIPVAVNSAVERVTFANNKPVRCTTTGEHIKVTIDPPLPREQVTKACNTIAHALEERRSQVCTFDELLPTRLWTHQSQTGAQTPIGHRDGLPVQVTIGDTSPHVLIGGPSGSGKTNFLYAMLGGLCAKYSPDELELYLLDFKEGVSFAQFAPGRKDPTWLPNARLVGVNVNQDREFGLALLRFLGDEMRRRADAAKRHEVTKLEELRAEDPNGRWPRIIAVIDEFQYLFAERDGVTRDATALLEDVARRGRSQGIHLVLASQDVSGIEAFWGKPAIFEQFTLRVALPKAKRVMADLNDVAIELPRWHAVVNHESGVKHGNEIARIPDSTARGTFDQLQARLFELKSETLLQPRLFDGAKVPVLDDIPAFNELQPVANRSPVALLGQVIDVEDRAAKITMARAPGRNMVVFGSAARECTSVLAAATLSLAKQHNPGEVNFIIAPLIEDSLSASEKLTEELRSQGHKVDTIALEGIRGCLTGTAAELSARLTGEAEGPLIPKYLVLYGMDASQTILESKDPKTLQSGIDALRQVIKNGPENRTHIIGWWRSAQRLKSILMMGASADDIGSWVAFDAQGSDLTSFAPGQLVTWSPRPGRGLFFDRFEHSRPQVIIPFSVAGSMDED